MLELGCGDGGNLVPDGAGAARRALRRHRRLGAGDRARPGAGRRARPRRTSTLEAAAIEELEPPPERFDYVIAHGVYSWVAAPVRDRLLELCRAVAVGARGRVRQLQRAARRPAVRGAARHARVPHRWARRSRRAGRAGAGAASLPGRGLAGGARASGRSCARQAERLLERSDETLFHDELAAINEPVYFHEFAAHAARHGLQYLAEADFFEMQTGVLPEAVAR